MKTNHQLKQPNKKPALQTTSRPRTLTGLQGEEIVDVAQRVIHAPTALSFSDVTLLQQTIGNQSVMRFLNKTQPIRAKSDIIQPDRSNPEVLTMEPERVIGDRGGSIENNVSNLEQLRGQGRDPNEPEMSRDDATIARNSPNPGDLLPFTKTGWNANEIMTRLGQYDTIAGTDSDSKRCVQAVAMASHIPSGPDAVAGYLNAIVFDGLLSKKIEGRQRTAIRVIELVKERITGRKATYGDLSWAQEAIHDLFYNDFAGTPGQTDVINQQITPTLDGLSRNTESLNIWCNTPAEVVAQTHKLQPGGQLIVEAWTVVFNSAFDQVEEQGHRPSDRMRVQINKKWVWIRRIPTDHRPSPQDIHLPSDSKSGHQLLIMKDNDQTGTIRLYEPEITNSGQHLMAVSPSGQEFEQYLKDNTQYGIYGYIQIMGRVTPLQVPSLPSW